MFKLSIVLVVTFINVTYIRTDHVQLAPIPAFGHLSHDGDFQPLTVSDVPNKPPTDHDSVIIDAASTRRDKQFENVLLPNSPCLNNKGEPGVCWPFRKCYPYFKLPDLNNWETWILGMYDTCAFFSSDGQQEFGVCCVDPPIPATDKPLANDTASNEVIATNNRQAVISNWPPPLPTHRPGNTIPPLPTHPSSQSTYRPITVSKPQFTISTRPITARPIATRPITARPITTRPITARPITARPITARPTSKPTTSSQVEVGQIQPACGSRSGSPDQERIVGGHNADMGAWPWIAALFNGGRQFCGGSLIDDTHILTAAHCVAHMSSWDVARLTVRLGDYNIKTNAETKHQEKRVKRIVRHRGFDARTLYNDIALVTLESPVTFSRSVRPICLPTTATRADFSGKTATVVGWGSLRESGPQSSILQEVNIPIWTNSQCKQKYGAAAPGGIVDHMICAGQAARDSCSGDSGGPMMVNEGRWTQVGVVSWGIGCGKGQYPGVYTRVTSFLPWIQKNLKN